MRMHKSSDPYKYSEAMSRVIDGLRGEAFTVAQQVGLENLWQCGSVLQQASQRADAADTASQHSAGSGGRPVDLDAAADALEFKEPGVELLIKAMKIAVFPFTTHEAKEMFRQYCKPSGSLSRQRSESMHQFIDRRKRCWKLLKELDPEIELSEGHRADMLLDLAGIDRNERIMIQAST